MSAVGPVIGIVGQVCAGKGTVAEALRRRGARVLDADRVVHALYGRKDVQEDVKRIFGPQVLDANNDIDRARLADEVFERPERLKALTDLLYPRVGLVFREACSAHRRSTDAALVLDAPTLFEAGLEGLCDRILFVAAPRERRVLWSEKRQWPPGEIARRERWLKDEDGKRARCHAVIDNGGSLEDLDRQVGELWSSWVDRDGEKEESKA